MFHDVLGLPLDAGRQLLQKHGTVFTASLSLVFASVVAGQAPPEGRLWLTGPYIAFGTIFNEIHEFDLSTTQRTTVATFAQHPNQAAMCDDGTVYVLVDPNKLYRLDADTAEILSSCDLSRSLLWQLACKSDGNLLAAADGDIYEYSPDCTELGTWVSGLSTVRYMTRTPDDTVAFLIGHPDVSTQLVEYNNVGQFLRTVIEYTSDGMDSFVFPSNSTILVSHRGSNCIKEYDWAATPATPIGDFVCDSSRLGASLLALHPLDGSVYAATHDNGCIYAWSATGQILYGGQPMACYGTPFYPGRPLILALADQDGDGIVDDDDGCPQSDLNPVIVIDGCNAAVGNPLFTDGCTMTDLIMECADNAVNHNQFVNCVTQLVNAWQNAGLITAQEKKRINKCAYHAHLP